MVSSKPSNWHLLPPNLFFSIAEKLFVADIIRLQVVCKAWAWSLGRPCTGWPTPPRCRASFVPIPPSVPWMLLPNENGEGADCCSFLDLSDGHFRRISPVPELVGRRCVGASPDGWLVTLDLELNPRVLNPLTREELPLPSLFTLFSYPSIVSVLRDDSDGSLIGFIDKGGYSGGLYHTKEEFRDDHFLKIVLTSAPPLGVAAVIFGSKPLMTHLALARVGDASWTPVTITDNPSSKLQYVEDVRFDKESCKLYVVTSSGSVHFVDLHISDWPCGIQISPVPLLMKPTLLASGNDRKPLSAYIGLRRHIIYLSGRLLQICRYIDEYDEREVQRLREGLPLDDEGDEDEELESYTVKAETIGVRIMKFDPTRKPHGRTHSWIPASASDLNDQAIFVGCNHVFSLPATDRPGLRKNSVYFTETSRYYGLEWRGHVRDAGVFDVETGTFQRFFPSDSQVNWPPPQWFMPCQLRFEILP